MAKDYIVEEVRRIRHEIERECQGDSKKFFEYYEASQKKLGNRVVRREPKHLNPLPQKEATG